MRRFLLPAIALLLLPATQIPAARAAQAPAAQAAQAVDVVLVLVDDVSGSINDEEFQLQKQGYAAAFADPRVLSAITGGPNGAVAVAYVEFAGDFQVSTVVDWTVVRDAASARAFAAAMNEAPRSARGRTAIGAGIDLAVRDLATSGFDAARKVIDVCGDGTNNSGRPVTEARDEAVRQDITINGLAIANESDVPWLQLHTHPPGGLDEYYRQNVTGGENSFVLIIHDYASFGQAITRKLVDEIASLARPPAG
jgi:hypothetical protein